MLLCEFFVLTKKILDEGSMNELKWKKKTHKKKKKKSGNEICLNFWPKLKLYLSCFMNSLYQKHTYSWQKGRRRGKIKKSINELCVSDITQSYLCYFVTFLLGCKNELFKETD